MIFTIKGKYPFSKAEVSCPDTVPFTYGGAKPDITVVYQGRTLTLGKDYSISFSGNKELGEAKALIRGKGSYSGEKTVSFKVEPREISSLSLQVEDMPYQPKAGKYFPPKIVFTDEKNRNQKLSAGVDYTVTEISKASDVPKEGTEIRFRIEAKGNYKGTIENASYRIIRRTKDFTKAKVTVNKGVAYDYTGKPVIPAADDLEIKIGNETISPENYEILQIYNNVDCGTATMRIRGKETMRE